MTTSTTSTDIAQLRSLPDVVAEYEAKVAGIDAAISAFEAAGSAIKAAACVAGEWGEERIETGGVSPHTMKRSLLRSAWRHVWKGLNLPSIASAKDKRLFEQAMSGEPAPFTLENLRATFGPYLENPRMTILRGMAEVFADLDPAFKSHEKVKIGVKGLPKRVIITGLNSYGGGWGWDKVRDIINALAAYQGKPLVTGVDMAALRADGEALREAREVLDPHESEHVHRRRAERGEPANTVRTVARGVWLKRFKNDNGHLYFGPDELRDINRALAEFYGDVLADCPDADEDRPAPRASTAVSKDLQFYPTPQKVIDRVIGGLQLVGKHVLEPSCGNGIFMVALKRAGAASVTGIEVDRARAQKARMWGMPVQCANFLETIPNPIFDLVVMNPPFYGKHYAKHVRHALRFLKPGGKLVAILPATARYDHGLLDDLRPDWMDLPVGAFSESGTNVCTTIATIRNKDSVK